MPKGSIRSSSQNAGNVMGDGHIFSNNSYGNSIFVLGSTNLQEISETHIQDRELDQKPENDFTNTDPSPVPSPRTGDKPNNTSGHNVRKSGQEIFQDIIENLNMEKYYEEIFEKDAGKHFQVSFAPGPSTNASDVPKSQI